MPNESEPGRDGMIISGEILI